jgi:hypothetical protein
VVAVLAAAVRAQPAAAHDDQTTTHYVLMLLVLQEASVLLNDVPVAQVVQTVPAIDFEVTAAAASADGHQLLLVGATRQVCNHGLL